MQEIEWKFNKMLKAGNKVVFSVLGITLFFKEHFIFICLNTFFNNYGFFNENNVKLKHEFKLLGKSGYLFGYTVFPDSPVIGLQKRKHKKIRKSSEHTCH